MKILYCYACDQNLPAKMFDKDSNRTYGNHRGYSHQCKVCKKANRSIISELVSSARKRAIQKHLPFSISTQIIRELNIRQSERCAISNIRLNWTQSTRIDGQICPFDRASIDRIDPKLGYTKSNVQLVIDMANRAKGSHTIKEVVAFCKSVAKLNS